jgi:WD40 repeat protein
MHQLLALLLAFTGEPEPALPWKLRLTLRPGGESGVVLSPDGKRLVTNCSSALKLWDSHSGKELATFRADRTHWQFLGFAEDGTALVAREDAPHPPAIALSDKPSLTLLDLATGKPLGALKLPEPFALLVRSPDGKTFATVPVDYQGVKLWDATGKELRYLALRAPVYRVLFSADGKLLVAWRSDHSGGGELRAWSVATGRQQLILPVGGWQPILALSPDGRMLATAHTRGGPITVWEAASGQVRAVLTPPTRSQLQCLAFSPDSRTLVANWRALGSGPTPAGLALWDLAAGGEPVVLKGHTGIVQAIAFSADGSTLASADSEGVVLVWGREHAVDQARPNQ